MLIFLLLCADPRHRSAYELWGLSKLLVQVTEQYECHIRYNPLSLMSVQMSNFASRIRMEHPDPARKLSVNQYDIYHCCVYSLTLILRRSCTGTV